jgi:hypothetical protein
MIYITYFHEDWFRHSEAYEGRGIHRQHADLISLLFKIRKVG